MRSKSPILPLLGNDVGMCCTQGLHRHGVLSTRKILKVFVSRSCLQVFLRMQGTCDVSRKATAISSIAQRSAIMTFAETQPKHVVRKTFGQDMHKYVRVDALDPHLCQFRVPGFIQQLHGIGLRQYARSSLELISTKAGGQFHPAHARYDVHNYLDKRVPSCFTHLVCNGFRWPLAQIPACPRITWKLITSYTNDIDRHTGEEHCKQRK
jgi:hypothetical protein